MSEIWLGAIGPPYETARFWVAGQDKEQVREVIDEELEHSWGEDPPFDWHESNDRYEYCKNTHSTPELRKIMLVD